MIIANRNLLIGLLLLLSTVLGMTLRPTDPKLSSGDAFKLVEIIPKQFADWTEVPSNLIQTELAVVNSDAPTTDRPYDDLLMRTYVNSKGQKLMLALAYNKALRQEVKIHRPELCYTAQGFQVPTIKLDQIKITTTGKTITAKSMLAKSPNRSELVVYWIRIGKLISENAWQTRIHILQQGLEGNSVDGILVRSSQILDGDISENASLEIQNNFLIELVKTASHKQRNFLVSDSDSNE